jgi:amidase
MTSSGELAFKSVAELRELIASKALSPVELIEDYLRRIEKFDEQINAFVTVVGDLALDSAREAERELSAGSSRPLLGIPIPIKDLNETAGIRTTYSSRAYADYIPDRDAAVVSRLKGAGAIVIGKTNSSEFGTWPVAESDLNGSCRNPWNTELTAGGSSGGAAAAVAAGLSPAAQGSDGGGSIRIPASCCGIVGMKPSRGRVSLGPQLGEFWAGFSTDGPLARTVGDAALLLDIMSGYEVGDPYWAPEPARPFIDEVGSDPGALRIGVLRSAPTGVEVDAQVLDGLDAAVELLESLGHSVEEARTEGIDMDVSSHFIKVIQSSVGYHRGIDRAKIEAGNRALAEVAEATSSITYIEALEAMRAFTRQVIELWSEIDILVTPTLARPPIPVGWIFEEDDVWMQLIRAGMFMPFTPMANITGQPAVSLPLARTDEGVPIGIQFVGPPAGEDVLFRLAGQLESAAPWSDQIPPGFA